MAMSQSFSST